MARRDNPGGDSAPHRSCGPWCRNHRPRPARVSVDKRPRAGRGHSRGGWQEISFQSRARAWRYGFNVLDLSFSYAVAPVLPSDDPRPLSVAVDWVAVE